MTTSSSPSEIFEPSAALLALGDMIESAEIQPAPHVASAWDAAWIACMSNSAEWALKAQREFLQVVRERTASRSLSIAGA